MDCELTELPTRDFNRSWYYCPDCEAFSPGPSSSSSGRTMQRTCPSRAPSKVEIETYIERREKELGDVAAGILEKTGLDVGYKTVLAWLRHQPVAEVECGGCVSRREKLNDLSRKFKRWWRAQ